MNPFTRWKFDRALDNVVQKAHWAGIVKCLEGCGVSAIEAAEGLKKLSEALAACFSVSRES